MYVNCPICDFRPHGKDTFWIDANFTDYGRHVGLNNVTIRNMNSYPITIDVFRWQAFDGYPFYRGVGGTINAHDSKTWTLAPWVPSILWSEDPYVAVKVHDTYDSHVYGDNSVSAYPPTSHIFPVIPYSATILAAPVSVQVSTVPEPSS